jgi:hypothetical protein
MTWLTWAVKQKITLSMTRKVRSSTVVVQTFVSPAHQEEKPNPKKAEEHQARLEQSLAELEAATRPVIQSDNRRVLLSACTCETRRLVMLLYEEISDGAWCNSSAQRAD